MADNPEMRAARECNSQGGQSCPGAPIQPGSALETLLNQISRSDGLPAFLANIQEILSFQNNPYFTVHDIARVILRDLAMTTQILRLVNSIYFQTYQRQVQTVSGAVMLLGLENVRDLVMGLKLFENFRRPDALLAVKKLVLTSFLTAIQSQELAVKEKQLHKEEVFLTALLFDLGELLVAYFFREKYQQIVALAAAGPLSRAGAAKEVLHVSFEDLALATLKAWNFPVTLINRLAAIMEGRTPPTGAVGRLRKIVAGANSLARVLLKEDLTQEEWQRHRFKVCHSLGIKPEFLEDSLAASLKRFQELARILKVNLKEVGFAVKVAATEPQKVEACPSATKEQQRVIISPKETPPPSLGQEDDDEVRRLKFFYEVTEEIRQALAAKAEVNIVLGLVMEGLYRGLGFDRVAFCLVNPERTWLMSRFGLGEGVEKILPWLQTSLHATKNALALALRHKREYLVCPYRQPADMSLMDPAFWPLSQVQLFLVSPIHVDQVPIGLFYVDRRHPQATITELERQRLRSLRDLFIISIRRHRQGAHQETAV